MARAECIEHECVAGDVLILILLHHRLAHTRKAAPVNALQRITWVVVTKPEEFLRIADRCALRQAAGLIAAVFALVTIVLYRFKYF